MRYDHHCPVFNNCIGIHNIHYMCSLSVYIVLFAVLNVVTLYWYNGTEAYSKNVYLHRFALFVSFVGTYPLFGYACALFFFNSQGRTVYEIVFEMMLRPFPPKFKLWTNWRENMFTILGTWYPIRAIAFPYFYQPPITGLEYSFLPKNNKPEDFWELQTQKFENWWKGRNGQADE